MTSVWLMNMTFRLAEYELNVTIRLADFELIIVC